MSWLIAIASNGAFSLLLAIVAFFAERKLRMPALARALWILVLIKLVTPPLFTAPALAITSETACALGICGCEPHAMIPAEVRSRLLWLALFAWGAGCLMMAVALGRRWRYFSHLLKRSMPAPLEWQMMAAQLADQISLRHPPEILVVAGRLPPLVVPGWRRAKILLPRALMNELDSSQQQSLLLHELLHIKRRDPWVRVLELVVGIAYWWLPIFGAIGKRLRACEETCCDAAVIAHLPHARRDYARLLLDVVDFTDPLPKTAMPQATAMSPANQIEQRLDAILHDRPRPYRLVPATALTILAACAILPCGLHYTVTEGAAIGPSPDIPTSDTCDPLRSKTCTPFNCPDIRPVNLPQQGCHAKAPIAPAEGCLAPSSEPKRVVKTNLESNTVNGYTKPYKIVYT